MASSPELQTLRAKSARGEPFSLEETRLFVLYSRASYTAAEGKKGPAKSRNAKPPVKEEKDVNFF